MFAALMRCVQAVLTALAACVIVFALLPLAPGDVANRVLLARGVETPTAAEIEATRSELGLYDPMYTQVGAAFPTFVFALLALTFLVVGFQLGQVLSDVTWQAALIPAFIIGLDWAASWTELLRAGLIEAMASGYAEVARTRGVSELRILLRHALPNAILPFLTAIGVSIGALIGGAPLIEAIFTWHGLGAYLLEALSARNYPVIQAYVLIAALSYVAAALMIDLVSMMVDPRLRDPAI